MNHHGFWDLIPAAGRRIDRAIQNFLRNTKIRSRLLISFLLLTAIPIAGIGIFFYYSTYRDNEEKSIQYSENISTQVMRNISNMFDNYIDQFERVAMDNTTTAEIYTYDSLKVYQQVDIYSRIRYDLASVVCTSSGIDSFEIRTKSGERIYCGTPITNENISESPLLKNTMESPLMVWSLGKKETGSDDNSYIILAKKMVAQYGNEGSGFAIMTIDRGYIDNICSQMGNIVITDKDGKIISDWNNTNIMEPFDVGIMNEISARENTGKANSEQFFKTKFNGQQVLVSYDILSKNKWRVINIIPYSYLMESTIQNGNITLISIIAIILISIFVAVMVTKSISTPVTKLLDAMAATGHASVDVHMDEKWTNHKDEHAQLARGFNEMTTRIQTLIDEVYRSEINKKELEFRKKEAELNALQQQINPHFLYNTLETIFWMAETKGESEIGEMVTALGNFFKKSIRRGKEYVTVYEEIQNVQYYEYLQKIRFHDRFDILWNVDEEIYNFSIIKLILQPIIENAIVHGMEAIVKGGRIEVKGYQKDNKLYFEIIDNGKGMSKNKLIEFQEYINSNQSDGEGSVGVKNVHQRIRLYHGDEYGISIYSQEHAGVRVVLCLPVIILQN